MALTIGLAGGSGYVGGELLRLVAAHPDLTVGPVTAHESVGARLGEVHPHLPTLAQRQFQPTDPAVLAGADLVFLALPHGQSAAVAAQLPPETKVVNLGADFRLAKGADWRRYYSGDHAGTWTYGLPELPGARDAIAASDRVANTGCYAAAIILALAPLIAAEVASPDDVVAVAASGTSGAGRRPAPNLLASEVMGALSPYKVGTHQHAPEIKQASGARSLSFTPILAPMPRGILATVAASPVAERGGVSAGGVSAGAVREVLTKAYAGEPFVHLLPEGQWPTTASTLGSNACQLQVTVDADSGRILVLSALDNLGKGAAGQAVQCANLMLGLPETAGLTANGVAP